MSESLKVFENANLPTPEALLGALSNIKETCGNATGVAILKYDKTGHFVYGKNSDLVENGSKWAINVFSFIHGYIAWSADGDLLGETVKKMTEPLPDPGEAPANSPNGWQKQVGFNLRCVVGEDAGLEARYTTQSKGGLRAVAGIIAELEKQTVKDPSRPIPVVHPIHFDPKDARTFYDHKTKAYSRVLVPVFEIVDWIGGPQKSQPAPALVEAEVEDDTLTLGDVLVDEPKEGRRRRRRDADDEVAI